MGTSQTTVRFKETGKYKRKIKLTPCLSIPAEYIAERSPVKIWSLKSTPGEKCLDFLRPRQYLI